ncbi:hypothetical protein D3C72_1787850 [compost metagenome]
MRLEFAYPAPMESHHLFRALRNRQRHGQPIHLPRLRPQIGQTVPYHQHAALIEDEFAGQPQPGVRIFCGNRQAVTLLFNGNGPEHRRAIQPLAVAFNAWRAKQTVAQLGHQRHRDIHVQPAVSHRANQTLRILRRKVVKVWPPVDNFGERVRFDHHVCRRAFES